MIRNDLSRLPDGSPAIVTDASQAAGIGLVRALGRHRVPVVALDPRAHAPGFRSRYAVGLQCPDPGDEEAFVAFLLELGTRLPRGGVIFPAGDSALHALAHHARDLAASFTLPFPSAEELAALSGGELVRAAQRAGIEMAEPAGGGEILAFGSYCDSQSRAMALFTASVIPASSGHRRGVAVGDWRADVSDAGVRLLTALRFHGVSLVALRPDADGRLRLLSLTPRHWSWHALCDASGVDLSLSAYRDAVGKPYVARAQSNGVRWHVSLDDVLGEPLPAAPQLRAGTDGTASPGDPLPAMAALAQSLGRRWRKG